MECGVVSFLVTVIVVFIDDEDDGSDISFVRIS